MASRRVLAFTISGSGNTDIPIEAFTSRHFTLLLSGAFDGGTLTVHISDIVSGRIRVVDPATGAFNEVASITEPGAYAFSVIADLMRLTFAGGSGSVGVIGSLYVASKHSG